MWASEAVRESVRKLVHVPGGLLPAVFLLVFGYRGSVALAAFLLAYLGLGGMLAVHRDRRLPIVYAGILSTRRAEERFPTAAFQFLVSILLVGALFPIPIFLGAAALLAAGDGTAAIVGRRWGRRPLRWNPRKSTQGLAAGVLVGTPVAALFTGLGYRVEAAAGSWGADVRPDLLLVAFVVVAVPAVLVGGRILARILRLPLQANTSAWETLLLFLAAAVPLLFVLRGPEGLFAAPVLASTAGPVAAVGLAVGVAPFVMLAESRVNRHDNLVVPGLFAALVWLGGRLFVA